MNLEAFEKKINDSIPSDWTRFDYPVQYLSMNNDTEDFSEFVYESGALYKPDIDISMVWGRKLVSNYIEGWVEQFPKKHAFSISVIARYRGVPIKEMVYVWVDEGRHCLPSPKYDEDGTYYITEDMLGVAEVIYNLTQPAYPYSTLRDALSRAGIEVR